MFLSVFNATPILPPPDESTSSSGQVGQSATGSSTPMNIEYKTVGGSVSGVNASKGASTAIGINSLIVDVDQSVQNAVSTSALPGIGMDAASVLGAAPNPIDPQTMVDSLGAVASDLDEVNSTINSFLSDVSGMLGSSSPDGKIKGDKESEGAKKGERLGEAKGKKGGAEKSSSDAESSVAKSVSPDGEVTTTISTESITSNGGVMTSTTTTNSASTSSQSTSSESTEGAPPEDSVISMTEIENELGSLDNQESETLAQQQASQIDSIELDASDTMAGAAKLLSGANMMLDMAIAGFAVSMAGSAYQLQGVGSAAKEGDQAEMESIDEGNHALSTASEKSLSDTELATTKEGAQDPRKYNDAQASIKQMEISTKSQAARGNISAAQKESLDNQAAASKNALEQSRYMAGGTKVEDFKNGKWTSPTDKNGNALTNPDGSNVATPEQAVAFYQNQARAEATARSQQTTISYADLGRQGIKPGQTVSDEAAKRILGTEDPAEVKAFQDNVKNLSVNRNSAAWQQAYRTSIDNTNLYGGTFQALSKMFDSLGSMKNQQGQALQQEEQAGAQVESSTEQAMNQAVQQTESLADSIRQSQSAVAQDMSSMVSATRV